jgi:hypothetical protein
MSRFTYVGGGWFRDASVPKGEVAEMLHGDHAIKEALDALDHCGGLKLSKDEHKALMDKVNSALGLSE